MDWNSRQYLKFSRERTQPAIDLVSRIELENPLKILDIGCGPGNSTAVLKSRFPSAYILGVDNSPNMIETAHRDYPALDFALCDANRELSKLDNDFDLVFSNACIQWLPNHHKLLREMVSLLKPGGVVAVQTPMTYEEPIHLLIGEVTSSARWQQHFSQERIFYNLTPGEYFDLLSEISMDFEMWKIVYYHKMDSHEAILDWYSSTGLRPYLNQLADDLLPAFKRDILNEIIARYPKQKDGRVLFSFPRFFFMATK